MQREDSSDSSQEPGIRTVTYLRIDQPSTSNWVDVQAEGPHRVSILDIKRLTYDVGSVFDRSVSDLEVCERTIGRAAGIDYGLSLNPVSASVGDAATSVILLCGSKDTRKWLFLKRTYLPFLANELFTTLANTVSTRSVEVTLKAFEIQSEQVLDLLKHDTIGSIGHTVFVSEVIHSTNITYDGHILSTPPLTRHSIITP